MIILSVMLSLKIEYEERLIYLLVKIALKKITNSSKIYIKKAAG
jgi:hypothetical protein